MYICAHRDSSVRNGDFDPLSQSDVLVSVLITAIRRQCFSVIVRVDGDDLDVSLLWPFIPWTNFLSSTGDAW